MDKNIWDVAIIGGGGAGLTAGLYASRANLKTCLFEKMSSGGQIALTDTVENYPGFPEGITGPEISAKMEEQAKKYGTEFILEEVAKLEEKNSQFIIRTSSGKEYFSKTIILASGASFRRMGVPGEREFTGRGVSYCATCDGAFFKNKAIAVVGGGDSALQEGIFLTRFATQVHVIHRRDKLRASPILQTRALHHPKIDFIWNAVVESVSGSGKVENLKLKDVNTNQTRDFKTDGVFVFIGHDPETGYIGDFVKLDEKKYVIADPVTMETSRKGVFAAGEIRTGAVKQLVTACGEGCAAALQAQYYLENLEQH
ncbi:MAG: thioredoxin-disulfide reductase [Candidatus Omnitrophica bacterium]|nr:thioredoxin-disulfide reductase [Candidatus Omnitrophota bacterium]